MATEQTDIDVTGLDDDTLQAMWAALGKFVHDLDLEPDSENGWERADELWRMVDSEVEIRKG
jgi:hypothetical protein